MKQHLTFFEELLNKVLTQLDIKNSVYSPAQTSKGCKEQLAYPSVSASTNPFSHPVK